MGARTETTREERRRRGLLWLGGLAASAVMVLGVNGTLASWSTAIITNSTNTTKATTAVALEESSGGTPCVDTGTSTDNTATCSTINKYGGTASPLVPGGAANTTTVTMTNIGTGAGSLTVTASACTDDGTNTGDLCDEVDVHVQCGATPTTVFQGTLSAFAAAGAKTVTASLAAAGSVNCSFAVSLPSDAPSNVASMVASQPLVWTLTAA